MKCKTCKHKLPIGAAACPVCGAPAPARKKEGRFLRGLLCGLLIGLVLLSALCLTGLVGIRGGRTEASKLRYQGRGYPTAEKAAEAWLKALQKQDLKALLKTYLVEDYADENLLIEIISEVKLEQELTVGGARYLEPLGRASAAQQLCSDLLRNRNVVADVLDITGRGVTLKTLKDPAGISVRTSRSEETRDTLREYLSSAKLDRAFSRMEIGKIRKVRDEVDKDFLEDYADRYNADELCILTAELEIGGDSFWAYIMTVRRGGKWFVVPNILYQMLNSYRQAEGRALVS